jgi:hypothetical protein
MLGTFAALLLLYLWALLSAVWVHRTVLRQKPGLRRVLFASPVILTNLVAPQLLDHEEIPLLITPIGGVYSLAAFKVGAPPVIHADRPVHREKLLLLFPQTLQVLALCFNRGPLALPGLSMLQFLGIMLVRQSALCQGQEKSGGRVLISAIPCCAMSIAPPTHTVIPGAIHTCTR